ncbi:MAG TPA: AIM24 family protein [bacterium]|nr:AIM24 family protein [bacterium]
MAVFEVVEKQGLKMIKATINNEMIRAEAGALHYMRGHVQMDVAAPTAGGILKAMASGESIVRPTYKGVGEVYFGPPHFGEYTMLDLANHQWIVDRGAYVCSDAGVDVTVWRNKALTGFLSGEGFWQTLIQGTGRAVIKSGGPLEAIDLNGDSLWVDGNFAVARTGNIEFSLKRASKGFFASAASGEGIVHCFTGTGRVLLSPVPNAWHNLVDAIVTSIPVSSSS